MAQLSQLSRCPGPSSVVFDPTLTEYDFGPTHPMAPVRAALTMRLAAGLGVTDRLTVVPAPVADDELVASVHTRELMDAVKRAGADPLGFEPAYGLGSEDNPVFH